MPISRSTGRRAVVLMSTFCAAATLTGCATIVHGPRQSVQIVSEPAGATVYVDDEAQGTTPLDLDLRRKRRYLVRLEADGYAPATRLLQPRADVWAIIGTVFTGPISPAVDWATGSLYALEPDALYVALDDE